MRLNIILLLTLILAAVLTPFHAVLADEGSKVMSTPQEVWAGFDPRAEPLEMEILKRWTEAGVNNTEFYFTGMTNGAERVRVYGMYSAPVGGSNLPAILHIHGGGQTVNHGWLRYFSHHGYAVLSFDYCGEWTNRTKFTHWGSLKQGNHNQFDLMQQVVEPSVHVSSWYLWTRVSRRALTVLESQPEVDTNRMGIFGVSMGGTMVWRVAAMDHRVKAMCAIYGVGWTTYPDELDAPDPKANDRSVKLWRASMEPEAYAPLIQCPVLVLDATDDHYAKMDWAFRTINSLPDECRWAFDPRYQHHIAAEQENDLPMWMDTWLKKGGPVWPKTPSATVSRDPSGVPKLIVSPDPSDKVLRADLFYAVENRNPTSRFWRSAASVSSGGNWTASLPISSADKPLFAFANVFYESGICLSSPLVTVIPAKLGKVKLTDTTSTVFGDFPQDTSDWVGGGSATDPIPPVQTPLTNGIGPGGKMGIAIAHCARLVTHKIGDPKWRGPDGVSLQFEGYSPTKRELTIKIYEEEPNAAAGEFTAHPQLSGSEQWQQITLSAADFKDEHGRSLSNWQRAQELEIQAGDRADSQPLFTHFHWTQ